MRGLRINAFRQDTTPRMRGLRLGFQWTQVQARYNPAYAGTTRTITSIHAKPPIQPRVCGDYGTHDGRSDYGDDTTPRMRGLQRPPHQMPTSLRYNPAYAGTTKTTSIPWCLFPIQPRACGDYLPTRLPGQSAGDTTPRMRGLPSSQAHKKRTP